MDRSIWFPRSLVATVLGWHSSNSTEPSIVCLFMGVFLHFNTSTCSESSLVGVITRTTSKEDGLIVDYCLVDLVVRRANQ